MIKTFVPTEEKLAVIAQKMRTSYLYSSDEIRTEVDDKILIDCMFGEDHLNEHYEIGDFGGLASAMNITPGVKCGALLKL